MDESTKNTLLTLAQTRGTPCFVYFAAPIRQRIEELRLLFEDRVVISYAAKSNPNVGVLRIMQAAGTSLDVSSIAEAERGLKAGFSPSQIGFSGPAKRRFEIQAAVRYGIGQVICESPDQILQVDEAAHDQGAVQDILIRINPRTVPREFGLQMGGGPSQFGIDEEDLASIVELLKNTPHVNLAGFHIFSGGNSLNSGAIIENLKILSGLFSEYSEKFGIKPQRLVFGSGFGIPYFSGDQALDMAAMAGEINSIMDELRAQSRFARTHFVLEMGRYLIGSEGYMLTAVVGSKHSRGTDIRLCDAGFNNNLSAAGMMGTVMRRDWQFHNLTQNAEAHSRDYLLVGPLCASFDILGAKISLPDTRTGDILAVASSGAYGLTASPTRFISHPEPEEFIVDERGEDIEILDVTESRAHHPQDNAHLR